MLKEEILQKIEDAEKAYDLWQQRVKHLIQGIVISNEMIELDPKKSRFGSWLYKYAKACNKNVFFSELITSIEEDHLNIHRIYFKIYRIYFVDSRRKFIASLILGKKKEISPQEHSEAIEYYDRILVISERMLLKTNQLKRKIKISPESVIREFPTE